MLWLRGIPLLCAVLAIVCPAISQLKALDGDGQSNKRMEDVFEQASNAEGCITGLELHAVTGDKYFAGHDPRFGEDNQLEIILNDDETRTFDITGEMDRNQQYSTEWHISTSQWCARHSDIKEVHLLGKSYDGWYIASISTYTQVGAQERQLLTEDPDFNKWLDSNEDYPYDATDLPLTLYHVVDCGYRKPVCECRATASKCEFDLEVDEIRTFTSYQKLPSGEGIEIRGTSGVVFYLGDAGVPQPTRLGKACSDFGDPNCTEPHFVDGKTYRLAIAVNGQIPGPTLIVHEDQTVILNVKNNLTIEGISIHWHGMHQIGTPWMDGVGQVTQCQIGPGSTFQYIYAARPSGTFWYHSHSGAQRTDGFFGAMIVLENPSRLSTIKQELQPFGLQEFEDLPGEHSLTLLDWQQESSLDLFTQINSGLGFHEGKPIGDVPTDTDIYSSTYTYDGSDVGPVPYFSGLINGKGRHCDVDYLKTRLSVFYVEHGKTYRFRLIGAQGLYQYKFSVDGHKLIVVGTDGYWTRPEKEVDYIIVHTGERYDFFLEANATSPTNFWMRAETLEVNKQGQPPYTSKGHVAEAILHYRQASDTGDPDTDVPPSQYSAIKSESPTIECNEGSPCKAVNCPFRRFHSSYNIECVNVDQLQLLESTPDSELPDAYPSPDCEDCIHFINFNFEGDSETSAVNGRNFILPAYPPQTQHEEFVEYGTICDLEADCNPSTLDCLCTHVRSIPYGETVQFVLSAVGKWHNGHPIHLHGHSFHVVHIGYPEYDSNDELTKHSSDIGCGDEHCTAPDCEPKRCTQPGWASGPPPLSISNTTVRKDTVVVPAGGYVVINFLSNNPGYWFLHCHIEVHQLEGMAVIVNEALEEQNTPPVEMNKCGDFITVRRTL